MAHTALPDRFQAAVFACKAFVFQLRRGLRNLGSRPVRRWPVCAGAGRKDLAGESISPLDAGHNIEERPLVLGKIENLRVALKSLHGCEVPAGGTFSFWAQIGAPVARRAYVPGRELREGCIIPSIGGGLCQLSNALYQAALQAGLVIVERHAHSQLVPGSAAELGKDATVFWNYVDLRLRSSHGFRIEARLDRDALIVRIMAPRMAASEAELAPAPAPAPAAANAPARAPAPAAFMARQTTAAAGVKSCGECGEDDCYRRATLPAAQGRTVYLVDAVWPEFDAWIGSVARPGDRMLLPVDGQAKGRARYAWTIRDGMSTHTFPLLTIWRALVSRRLASQGAARQRSAQQFHGRLAASYAGALHYLDEHLVLTQELLPYLWDLGCLQGRSYDVMMTALPMREMQQRLNLAFARHPDSPTLNDFRAPAGLAEMELAALRQARKLITPHADVARLSRNCQLLAWRAGKPRPRLAGSRIIFPASTLGRKGAYELREAARVLDLRLFLLGPVLEAASFWDGIDVVPLDAKAHWLDEAAVVVLPAWSENRPARLLEALACGVAVIATPACGLPAQACLTLVDTGDVAALITALLPFAPTAPAPAGTQQSGPAPIAALDPAV